MNDNLLKVLLVDDEQNTRNLLKICIDWKALGMEVVSDAASGIEALSMIEELRPDIVLTDIEMPYMDGITLSKQIMEHYIDTYIIMITAHEQFSYAQQAISIGVSDFILKPIDPEVISQTLKKLTKQILEKRKKLTELEVSYQYIQNNKKELRNQFLNQFINGNTSNTAFLSELNITKNLSQSETTNLQLSLIHILFEHTHFAVSKRTGILQNCVKYIEETFCSEQQELYVFTDMHNHIVLLSGDASIYLPELSEQITSYFKSNLHTPVCCGIGTIVSRVEDLIASYNYAKNALKLCYILGEDIVYNHNFENLNNPNMMISDNPADHLTLLVKSGLTEEAVKIASSLLHDSLQDGICDLSAVKYYAINILSKLTNVLLQAGVPASSLKMDSISFASLIELEQYADIEKYVISTILEFCRLMHTINGTKLHDTVSRIIGYLELHYADENLGLTNIAKEFYINPSYLSRIFKKVTNKSFTDYLVELRVQKAVQLLNVSSYKAYQLAQMVGIPDPNYFIKCFKKVTGVSLQEFKAQRN